MRTNFTNYEASTKQNTLQNLVKVQGAQADTNKNSYFPSQFNDAPSIIDRFVKKEIDLGSGIDFYKIVEEFENRLIFEALRRTNQNKNRAAQLLSMNRTTLVEKLKKRASSSFVKTDTKRSARNPAFTIFDELGSHHDNNDYTLPDMNENEREKESNP